MFIRKHLHQMVLPVFTEVSLSHVSVSSSTEDSISVSSIHLSPLFQPTWRTVCWLTSASVGELPSVPVWLHIQLIPSEEEWWWLQVKEKSTRVHWIALVRFWPLKDGNHSSRELVLTSWEVLPVQVFWPFTTSFSWSFSEKNSVLDNDCEHLSIHLF